MPQGQRGKHTPASDTLADAYSTSPHTAAAAGALVLIDHVDSTDRLTDLADGIGDGVVVCGYVGGRWAGVSSVGR